MPLHRCSVEKNVQKNQKTSSAVAEIGDRLATTDGLKSGGCAVPHSVGEGKLGPHLTQSFLGRGIPPYQVESWSIQPFGGHSTPTLQTERQDNGRVAYGEPLLIVTVAQKCFSEHGASKFVGACLAEQSEHS